MGWRRKRAPHETEGADPSQHGILGIAAAAGRTVVGHEMTDGQRFRPDRELLIGVAERVGRSVHGGEQSPLNLPIEEGCFSKSADRELKSVIIIGDGVYIGIVEVHQPPHVSKAVDYVAVVLPYGSAGHKKSSVDLVAESGEVLVDRGSLSEMEINDTAVSRREEGGRVAHMSIEFRDQFGHVFITDHHSTYGVRYVLPSMLEAKPESRREADSVRELHRFADEIRLHPEYLYGTDKGEERVILPY